MKIVPEVSLLKALHDLEQLSDEATDDLMDDFAERQPAMLAFTLSLESDFDDVDDFQVLFHLVVVIWQAFEIEFGSLPHIREAQILLKEEQSVEEVIGMADLDEEEMIQSAIEMFANIAQPVLMNFISEELVNLEEGGDLVGGDDAAGQIFPILKMVIELFDDALNKPSLRVV